MVTVTSQFEVKNKMAPNRGYAVMIFPTIISNSQARKKAGEATEAGRRKNGLCKFCNISASGF